MSYRPLADVRKDLRVEWYRCPIDGPKLRELSRRSDLQGWYQAGGHLALFLLTGAVTYFFWLQQIWVGVVIALLFHGTVDRSCAVWRVTSLSTAPSSEPRF